MIKIQPIRGARKRSFERPKTHPSQNKGLICAQSCCQTQRCGNRIVQQYARVSKSEDHNTQPQIDTLEAAECKLIFEERASGGRWDRPELHRLLSRLRPGDGLVVWKLDQRFLSVHDPIANLVPRRRDHTTAAEFRSARVGAFAIWNEVAGLAQAA